MRQPSLKWEGDQWDQRLIGDPTVPQTLTSPGIDQSPSNDRDQRQWDQTPSYWIDTPLGQWAIEANRWDGTDSIPPDEEPFSTPNNPPDSRSQPDNIVATGPKHPAKNKQIHHFIFAKPKSTDH
ncbi:MAG: hypothetical protein P8L49_06905 [Opitutaceae bacterium]|nr:hypothetical protein [Opitutaceae bacterium]